jgi:hypothetical protein
LTGALSSNSAWLVGVMKKVNVPNCGTLCDLSNFSPGKGQEHDGYTGVAEMMPLCPQVPQLQRKLQSRRDRLPPDRENRFGCRLLRLLRVVRARVRTRLLDEPEAIRATMKLLEIVRAEVSAWKR